MRASVFLTPANKTQCSFRSGNSGTTQTTTTVIDTLRIWCAFLRHVETFVSYPFLLATLSLLLVGFKLPNETKPKKKTKTHNKPLMSFVPGETRCGCTHNKTTFRLDDRVDIENLIEIVAHRPLLAATCSLAWRPFACAAASAAAVSELLCEKTNVDRIVESNRIEKKYKQLTTRLRFRCWPMPRAETFAADEEGKTNLQHARCRHHILSKV